MRELSVQAANGTYADGSAERTSIGEELMQLREEIDRISSATQFNGQKLLNGSLSTTLAGTGAQVGDAVGTAVISKIDVSKAQSNTSYTLAYAAGDLTLSDTSGNSFTIDISSTTFSGETTLNFAGLGVSITLAGTDDSADIGAALNTQTIETAVGSGAASLQIGANTSLADNTLSLAFNDMSADAIGVTAAIFDGSSTVVADQSSARDVIDAVDAAINTVNSQRGTFGAAQNRLEHTIKSLSVAVENLSAAESRIRDADIAELSSAMVSQQILQQAGISVLSQANAAPQAAINLLR
jgi:flagellin